MDTIYLEYLHDAVLLYVADCAGVGVGAVLRARLLAVSGIESEDQPLLQLCARGNGERGHRELLVRLVVLLRCHSSLCVPHPQNIPRDYCACAHYSRL